GGDNPVAIAYQHVQETPASPRTVNPDVPAAYEAIVLKALAKRPDDRYASANDLRTDLLRFREGQPTAAAAAVPLADATRVQQAYATDGTRVATVTEMAGGQPPHRRTGAFIVLMLALLAILGVLLFLLYRQFS